ncbi:MAG: phospholipid carrier-dependent glycosyltransferase [Bacillota bacterium]
MKFFKILFSLIITITVLTINFLPSTAANVALVVKDPSFEKNVRNSSPFWSFDSYDNIGTSSLDSNKKNVHTGKYSLLITNPKGTHSKVNQNIIVEPNSIYHFQCWVKAENVQPDTTICVNMAINNSLDGYSKSILTTKNEWQLLEMYKKTDATTKELGFQLAIGGYGSSSTGKAWFDDVAIEKVDSVPANWESKDANIITFSGKSGGGDSNAQSNSSLFLFIGIIVLVIAGIAAYLVFSGKNKKKLDPSQNASTPSNNNLANSSRSPKGKSISKTSSLQVDLSTPVPVDSVKLKIRDFIIMGVVTIAYAVFAFTNLGSLSVPETGWQSVTSGDSFVLKLEKPINPSRVGLYYGYGTAKYIIEAKNNSGNFTTVANFVKEEGNMFKWNFQNMNADSDTFRVTVTDVGYIQKDKFHNGTLNEIAFYNLDPTSKTYKQIDITGAKITDTSFIDSTADNSSQNFSAMIDEQKKVDSYATYYNGFYFDEIYHARTAYENIHNLPVYETTHPPLGKFIISLGIRIFGMNPFGWRCMGTLFGVMMLPLMYLFGLKLFRKRFLAFAAMMLMTVDFMHFSLSRIATIDIYGTFFVLLMYYFMHDYFVYKSINLGYKKSLRTLLLCGIALGLGAASKWIGLYAAAGLALLFFLTKYQEYSQYKKITSRWKSSKSGWVKDFDSMFFRTLVWCILFFLVIPLIIYIGSYFPTYLNVPGSDFSVVTSSQTSMYSYHSTLNATHSYSSMWYQWPFDTRPLYVFGGMDLPEGSSFASKIFIMGNPLIFWLGIIAVPLAAYFAIKRRSRSMLVVFIAIFFQYMPWVLVTRIAFIYHIFSTLPFIIFSIVYVINCVFDHRFELYKNRRFISLFKSQKVPKIVINPQYIVFGVYLILCTGLFFMFYPILSGYVVSIDYIKNFLNWFGNQGKDAFFKWDF